jgi:hypothetical protein
VEASVATAAVHSANHGSKHVTHQRSENVHSGLKFNCASVLGQNKVLEIIALCRVAPARRMVNPGCWHAKAPQGEWKRAI